MSILETIIERANIKDSVIFREVNESAEEVASLTYKELHLRASILAEEVLRKTKANERVVLLYPTSLDFIVAFTACLYAGVIAVPINPPTKNNKLHRLISVIKDAEPSLILTTSDIALSTRDSQEFAQFPSVEWFSFTEADVTDLSSNEFNTSLNVNIAEDDVAFLQYTSGSTGDPKGVVVTHKNLISNLQLIQKAFEVEPDSVLVSWLPMFHDMGLIGKVLQSIYTGCTCIIINSSVFLRSPDIWLRVISQYRGTHSGAPNFGFEHCHRRIKKDRLSGIDLSSWKVAFSGSEPIRKEVFEQFVKRFQPFGFSPSAFFPTYGMAEATLCVSAPPVLRGPLFEAIDQNDIEVSEHFKFVASCGSPREDMEVSIVHPETLSLCQNQQVGEIWLKGNSVAQGYWNKPEKTRESFLATLDKVDGYFYRTGDLGYLKDNELYITGRLSDVIIIRGVNYYPQDIEAVIANSDDALVNGGTVAFSIEVSHQEQLIILQELERTAVRKTHFEALRNKIQGDLYKSLGLRAHSLIFLKPGRLFKTSSGKVQRRKSRQAYLDNSLTGIVDRGSLVVEQSIPSFDHIQENILQKVADILNCSVSALDVDHPFADYGVDSVAAAEIAIDVENEFSIALSETILFDYPSIQSVSQHIYERIQHRDQKHHQQPPPVKSSVSTTCLSHKNTKPTSIKSSEDSNAIAIIGMAAKFPDATNLQEFWNNLLLEHDGVSSINKERWSDVNYFDDSNFADHAFPEWGGFIKDPYDFDPYFFNISPSEAELMDPQQRLFLQSAWHAFEDAGYTLNSLSGANCGVFVGCSTGDYHRLIEQSSTPLNAYTMMGNSHAILASRIAYFLNLKGVSTAVDTACSSSLLAVHMACESLRNGELSMALAAGVNVLNTPQFHLFANKAGMLSKTGRCQTFSNNADGFVPAEGVGVVVLKPLAQAKQEGHRIYGVIKASVSNQDGHTNGITAPNGLSQSELQRKAYDLFGINPRQIGYVEAHGTGTPLGDPIEVEALTRSFQHYTDDKQFCAIGSVKSNIGHTLAAAGIAGLIKAALCVREARLPASLHQNDLNNRINFADSPFYPVNRTQAWPDTFFSRMAAVSSFGYSGTNVHLVLENDIPRVVDSPMVAPQLCVLSAKNAMSLTAMAANLYDFLSNSSDDLSLYDLCYTLALHRTHFDQRIALVVYSVKDLTNQLSNYLKVPNKIEGSLISDYEMESLWMTMALPKRGKSLQKLAEHFCQGGQIAWQQLFTEVGNQMSLPLYVFEKIQCKVGNTNVVKPLDNDKLKMMNETERDIMNGNAMPNAQTMSKENIRVHLDRDIVSTVANLLKLDAQRVTMHDNIRDFGFDSINIVDLTHLLNENYQIQVTPPQLFEHQDLNSLSEFLLNEYGDLIEQYYTKQHQTLHNSQQNSVDTPPINCDRATSVVNSYSPSLTSTDSQPIAIVGYAGMLPGAENLDVFWQRLIAGDNLVCEVPETRWSWQSYYGNARESIGKTAINCGGFMPKVDQFDAKFFGMSHREANLTDPQQRLFLQSVWHALEHAGYNPDTLAGSQTGVFCGIFTADYNELLIESGYIQEAHAITGLAHSILPNRVSYLLDLRGPSVPIDTACSSSLVALHQAIESIQQGSCEAAIVGGVNVMVSPTPFLSASRAAMISTHCKTFDEKADGYARGEGVGAIVIKPLAKALEDRDTIHAVIKGTATNHGGAANSLTSPNPEAQADVVRQAVQRAGVSPERINYIEAHGTGTSLGDPIEINGLKKAYKDLYQQAGIVSVANHCALGTVKSSIGHLEAAAGIAGLLKVILALKHKELHANIHLEKANPYINLADSPFYLVKDKQDWPSLQDEQGDDLPRCAGISSFGFGGSNAHVIIEEWPQVETIHELDKNDREQLIILSAKTQEQLFNTAQALSQHLQTVELAPCLADIAFTLQCGRKHWQHRLAILCSELSILVEKLDSIVAGEMPTNSWQGNVDKNQHATFNNQQIDDALQQGHLKDLAILYLEGAQIDWYCLNRNKKVRRIPLPVYQFDNKRHWIPDARSASSLSTIESKEQSTSIAHEPIPHLLVGQIHRGENQVIILDQLKSDGYYFSQHKVFNQAILPAAAIIEIMRAGVAQATGQHVASIEDLQLLTPVTPCGKGSVIQLNLQAENQGKIRVRLERRLPQGKCLTHSEALVDISHAPSQTTATISQEMSYECTEKFKASDIYQDFHDIGLQYGDAFQALVKLKSNKYRAVGHLKLPKSRRRDLEDYILSPSLLDASMHTVLGIVKCRSSAVDSALVPSTFKKIIIHRALPSQCIVHSCVIDQQSNKTAWQVDIDIADTKGHIVLEIKGLMLRAMPSFDKQRTADKTASVQPYYWLKNSMPRSLIPNVHFSNGDCLVFHNDHNSQYRNLSLTAPNGINLINIYPAENYQQHSNNQYSLCYQDMDNYKKLFSNFTLMPNYIVYFPGSISDNCEDQAIQSLHSFIRLMKMMLGHSKKIKCQLLILVDTPIPLPITSAQTGLVRSLAREESGFKAKVVHTQGQQIDTQHIWNELLTAGDHIEEVFYSHEGRMLNQLVPWLPEKNQEANLPFKKQGVYWITGGAGGIGNIVAHYLAKHYQARLLLTGRRPQDTAIEQCLEAIVAEGGQAIYVSADVTDANMLGHALKQCQQYFGSIQGVLHSAGLVADGFLRNKSLDEFDSVIAPKINGIVNLDRVTSNEPLDFFVAFSSISAVTGNMGQTDYSAGNAFMDEFIRQRQTRDDRSGRSISINWPLWENGGMNIPDHLKKMIWQMTGMSVLKTEEGLIALTTALQHNKGQLVVATGDFEKINTFLQITQEKPDKIVEQYNHQRSIRAIESVPEKHITLMRPVEPNYDAQLQGKTEQYLLDMFAEAVAEESLHIDARMPFQELGVDSFIAIQLLSDLEGIFGELPKTLLFEHHCIAELSEYFVKHHASVLQDVLSLHKNVDANRESVSNDILPPPLFITENPENIVDSGMLQQKAELFLLETFSEAVSISTAELDANTPFQELGVDSFIAIQLLSDLEAVFGELPKTLLFENHCITDLAAYFVSEHSDILLSHLSLSIDKVMVNINPHDGTVVNHQVDTTTLEIATPVRQSSIHSSVDITSKKEVTDNRTSLCFLEKRLDEKNQAIITAVENLKKYYGAESTAMGRSHFAPYIFIGESLEGFFYCHQKDNFLVTFGYIGPEDYLATLIHEIENYTKAEGKELYLVDQQPLLQLREQDYITTPFAVLQRVNNIQNFSIKGKAKRKLRQKLSSFNYDNNAYTKEYVVGDSEAIDLSIIEMIDRWCQQKVMVNPYIKRLKDDIQHAQLESIYRVFLTWHDDRLQNIIIISSMTSNNGYLMDCEFYTEDMLTGGLEFAIVSIIEQLKREGCDVLSLGVTWGAQIDDQGYSDSKARKILAELAEKNIFDGSGNLQFKNKFTPHNQQIYLLRSKHSTQDRVLDIILMIANSEQEPVSPAVSSHSETFTQHTRSYSLDRDSREQQLIAAGLNPANIVAEAVEFDLSTDSWAKLAYCWTQSPASSDAPSVSVSKDEVENQLRRFFPFAFLTLTHSGSEAENCLWESIQTSGKRVLQNRMFPSFIYSTMKAGYKPEEISAKDPNHPGWFDVQVLAKELEQDSKNIAAVCIELAPNATGGQAIPVEHIQTVKILLAQYRDIPLIIDATRLLDNTLMLTTEWDQCWDTIHASCGYADVVTASLSKNFMVSSAGLVACNEYSLAQRIDGYAVDQQFALSSPDLVPLSIRLQQPDLLFESVKTRHINTQHLLKALQDAEVECYQPASDWSVLIDVNKIKGFQHQPYPLASFLHHLYLHTGIRAGLHSTGLNPNPPFNGMLRLVVPVGMQKDIMATLLQRVSMLKTHQQPEMVLELVSQPKEFAGHVKARYQQKVNQPQSVPLELSVSADAISHHSVKHHTSEDIAIIGVGGRYPQANSIDEFWQNLQQGRDCIEKKPLARWGERLPSGHDDIPDTRWGGFIDDIDKFDAMFFNISPREAALLDPQERLFLQVAWETLEDAGYTPESLVANDDSRRVGVYVGAVWQLYQMLGAEQTEIGNLQTPHSLLWSVANRVSSFMDFTGPSMAVDTACSGSLAAIYLACQAIQNGECHSAIVGGVNLDLHDSKWLLTRASGFLSPDGRCQAFADGANGYVAGEGIGAVLLKPLTQALADKDNLYGVIKACSFNHGGRASGYSVPNPNAQSEMIAEAIAKANVDARTINYIETHGTGTQLGDPIEIRGLTTAYRRYTCELNFCALGSVKSNIGHLEAAAGIAGLTKLLLQMRHRTLVPSLHCEQTNELIPFAETPFYVQKECVPWEPVVIDGQQSPLRAGVSSFGAGGANLHVIIEEAPAQVETIADYLADHIIVISAHSPEQLQQYAERLLAYLQETPSALKDIAYTLQVGRKAMQYRLAMVVESIDQLQEIIGDYIKTGKANATKQVFSANTRDTQKLHKLLVNDDMELLVDQWLQQSRMDKIAHAWAQGLIHDLSAVSECQQGYRISLPTYPFARVSHWIKKSAVSTATSVANSMTTADITTFDIHPLLGSNHSAGDLIHFQKTIDRRQYVFSDHIVAGYPTLPGVAYLEMALSAYYQVTEQWPRQIRHLIWLAPITSNKHQSIDIYLKDNTSLCDISTGSGDNLQLHAQCKFSHNPVVSFPDKLDLDHLRQRFDRHTSKEQCYSMLEKLQFGYGHCLQAIEGVQHNETEGLTHLVLPPQLLEDFNRYYLHPSLMDGAIQSIIALVQHDQTDKVGFVPYVPFVAKTINIFRPLTAHCYAYIRLIRTTKDIDTIKKVDLTLVDEQGNVLVDIHEVSLKAFSMAEINTMMSSTLESINNTADVKNAVLLDDAETIYISSVWE